ncbi:hypothetical protein JXA88_08905 [Candidatus Fermentibacteria bacterium]|nr:hypothetical protein [Candidatus Fermentibacteria bacterium]
MARFGDRADAWEGRGIPGWRGDRSGEIALAVAAVLVAVAALTLRLPSQRRPTVLVAGPASALRAGAALMLLLSGGVIYFGGGWMLEHVSHVHVLAGALLLAAYAEPVLLLARHGIPLRRVLPSIRMTLVAVLSVSGIALLAPTLTPALDGIVPMIRDIHRAGAAALALWIIWAVIRRQPPAR